MSQPRIISTAPRDCRRDCQRPRHRRRPATGATWSATTAIAAVPRFRVSRSLKAAAARTRAPWISSAS